MCKKKKNPDEENKNLGINIGENKEVFKEEEIIAFIEEEMEVFIILFIIELVFIFKEAVRLLKQ